MLFGSSAPRGLGVGATAPNGRSAPLFRPVRDGRLSAAGRRRGAVDGDHGLCAAHRVAAAGADGRRAFPAARRACRARDGRRCGYRRAAAARGGARVRAAARGDGGGRAAPGARKGPGARAVADADGHADFHGLVGLGGHHSLLVLLILGPGGGAPGPGHVQGGAGRLGPAAPEACRGGSPGTSQVALVPVALVHLHPDRPTRRRHHHHRRPHHPGRDPSDSAPTARAPCLDRLVQRHGPHGRARLPAQGAGPGAAAQLRTVPDRHAAAAGPVGAADDPPEQAVRARRDRGGQFPSVPEGAVGLPQRGAVERLQADYGQGGVPLRERACALRRSANQPDHRRQLVHLPLLPAQRLFAPPRLLRLAQHAPRRFLHRLGLERLAPGLAGADRLCRRAALGHRRRAAAPHALPRPPLPGPLDDPRLCRHARGRPADPDHGRADAEQGRAVLADPRALGRGALRPREGDQQHGRADPLAGAGAGARRGRAVHDPALHLRGPRAAVCGLRGGARGPRERVWCARDGPGRAPRERKRPRDKLHRRHPRQRDRGPHHADRQHHRAGLLQRHAPAHQQLHPLALQRDQFHRAAPRPPRAAAEDQHHRRRPQLPRHLGAHPRRGFGDRVPGRRLRQRQPARRAGHKPGIRVRRGEHARAQGLAGAADGRVRAGGRARVPEPRFLADGGGEADHEGAGVEAGRGVGGRDRGEAADQGELHRTGRGGVDGGRRRYDRLQPQVQRHVLHPLPPPALPLEPLPRHPLPGRRRRHRVLVLHQHPEARPERDGRGAGRLLGRGHGRARLCLCAERGPQVRQAGRLSRRGLDGGAEAGRVELGVPAPARHPHPQQHLCRVPQAERVRRVGAGRGGLGQRVFQRGAGRAAEPRARAAGGWQREGRRRGRQHVDQRAVHDEGAVEGRRGHDAQRDGQRKRAGLKGRGTWEESVHIGRRLGR